MAHKNKSNYSAYKARRGEIPPVSPAAALRGRHRSPDRVFTPTEADERLFDLFRNHGAEFITHEQRRKFALFYHLLMEEQQRHNITRLHSLRDVAIRHFIDSVFITQLCELRFPLLDIGTGPGFPGIPLKILFPDRRILLAEGVQRRVAFLKEARERLDLHHLDIVGRNINKFFVYPVQGVITRAVEDMRNTLGNAMSCLQEGGRVYFMKGPGVAPEIPQALAAWGEFYRLVEDIPYTLPHTPHERRLVIFEKFKNAPLPNEEEQDFPLLEGE